MERGAELAAAPGSGPAGQGGRVSSPSVLSSLGVASGRRAVFVVFPEPGSLGRVSSA